MLPAFDESGLLPRGVHPAGLDEVQTRFAHNAHRRKLMGGFEKAVISFRAAGCKTIYLDGSFITAKEFPVDYDACREAAGVILALLDPIFLVFDNQRAAQKAKYFGEFFPAHLPAEATSPFRTFFNFFQVDKSSGNHKGIVAINIVTIL